MRSVTVLFYSCQWEHRVDAGVRSQSPTVKIRKTNRKTDRWRRADRTQSGSLGENDGLDAMMGLMSPSAQARMPISRASGRLRSGVFATLVSETQSAQVIQYSVQMEGNYVIAICSS